MMPQHYDTMQYTNIGMVCHTGLFVLCKISATKGNRPPLHYTTTRHSYQLKLSTTTIFMEKLISWFAVAKWNKNQHGGGSFSASSVASTYILNIYCM